MSTGLFPGRPSLTWPATFTVLVIGGCLLGVGAVLHGHLLRVPLIGVGFLVGAAGLFSAFEAFDANTAPRPAAAPGPSSSAIPPGMSCMQLRPVSDVLAGLPDLDADPPSSPAVRDRPVDRPDGVDRFDQLEGRVAALDARVLDVDGRLDRLGEVVADQVVLTTRALGQLRREVERITGPFPGEHDDDAA